MKGVIDMTGSGMTFDSGWMFTYQFRVHWRCVIATDKGE